MDVTKHPSRQAVTSVKDKTYYSNGRSTLVSRGQTLLSLGCDICVYRHTSRDSQFGMLLGIPGGGEGGG